MSLVALVAAKDAEASVAATVRALLSLPGVDEVWVVDDGSTDDTAAVAAAAGARIVRLEENQGKGGALAAGVAATPHATRYLLADADLGTTATGLAPLLDAVRNEAAAVVVGALPSAGGRGGFGTVKRFAAAGIHRACGVRLAAPLSGQRLVDADALRRVRLAPRFGVEVGMTIDVVRAGGRVVEVPVDVEHRHTGRSLAGFAHRGRQGRDIAAALFPRLVSVRARLALVVAAALAVLTLLSGLSFATRAPSGSPFDRADKVVLFSFDHLRLADLESERLPALRDVVADGAAGALSVRTTDRRSLDRRGASDRPSPTDAYASLGASARVRTPGQLARSPLRAEGLSPSAMARARALAKDDRAPSRPGALGDALRRSGKRTGFVGGAHPVSSEGVGFPAAAAIADRAGRIDVVAPGGGLLEATALRDGGFRVAVPAFVAAALDAVRRADVVVVDPGETARALFARADRDAALARTDAILAGLRAQLPPRTMMVVVSATPPAEDWELTPVVVLDGRHRGVVASASTRRAQLGTLTDLAPTVLQALDVPVPTSMTGEPLRHASARFDPGHLQRLSDDGAVRGRFFLSAGVGYTVVALALYAAVGLALATGLAGRRSRPLQIATLGAAAFPLAGFAVGGLQHWAGFGGESPIAVMALCALAAGLLARRRGLGALYWLGVALVVVVALDVAVTGPLHTASLFGYSIQTTGRFYGLPNASFAVFAASLLLVAAGVAGGVVTPSRSRAWPAAALLAVGVFVVGAPWLGNDVGGTLALAPVAAVLVWSFFGRRMTPRVALAALAAGALCLGALAAAEAAFGPTHLGRLLGEDASLASTLARRTENNLGLLVDQWWGFLVLLLAGGGVVALARNVASDELPLGSPLRAAITATLVLSVLAFIVNDSGPVVAVLCLVVAAPAVALRAIDVRRRRLSRR